MLLPYASDRAPRNPPLAVVSLVLANFLVFGLVALILAVRGDQAAVALFASLALIPDSLRWHALLTYAFLHDSVFHLSVNMLFLWVFGGSVEDAIGWKRFLALFAVAAALTGLLEALMAASLSGGRLAPPVIGASGAVSTVVGVFAVRFYRARIGFIGLPFRVPAILLVAGVMLLEMGIALYQYLGHGVIRSGQTAAHWAHAGGFALGILWAHASRLMGAGRLEYLAEDAERALERGSPLGAVHRLEAVLKAQPQNAIARAQLAKAWVFAGDLEQAREHYTRAIAGLIRQGSRREAAERFQEWRRSDPQARLPPQDQYAIAAALEEQGSLEEAVSALTELSEIDPGSKEAEMALLRVGVILLNRLERPREARDRLEQFLARYSESAWRAYARDLLDTARDRSPE